jgi:hypothetical protein
MTEELLSPSQAVEQFRTTIRRLNDRCILFQCGANVGRHVVAHLDNQAKDLAFAKDEARRLADENDRLSRAVSQANTAMHEAKAGPDWWETDRLKKAVENLNRALCAKTAEVAKIREAHAVSETTPKEPPAPSAREASLFAINAKLYEELNTLQREMAVTIAYRNSMGMELEEARRALPQLRKELGDMTTRAVNAEEALKHAYGHERGMRDELHRAQANFGVTLTSLHIEKDLRASWESKASTLATELEALRASTKRDQPALVLAGPAGEFVVRVSPPQSKPYAGSTIYASEDAALAWMAQSCHALAVLCRLVPVGTPLIPFTLLFRATGQLRSATTPELRATGDELYAAMMAGAATLPGDAQGAT